MTDFRALGEKLFAEQPELLLAAVWVQAYIDHPGIDQYDVRLVVEGYQAARARRDAFLAEQKETEPQ